MSLLAIIPARGGSKRIPGKNIKELCSKPLIAWAIEAAKEVSCIDRVVVSTEDEKIAVVSRDWGAEVPFLRPAELACDDTPGIDPVLHVLEMLPEFKHVLLLQPTSPLRTTEDIEGICHFQQELKASCVVSVCATSKHPSWTYQMTQEGYLQPFLDTPPVKQGLGLSPALIINGAMYLANCDWLRQKRNFMTAETYGYLMPAERSIDVDTFLDWEWVEFLMSKKNVT